jgi:hypothetical protein
LAVQGLLGSECVRDLSDRGGRDRDVHDGRGDDYGDARDDDETFTNYQLLIKYITPNYNENTKKKSSRPNNAHLD